MWFTCIFITYLWRKTSKNGTPGETDRKRSKNHKKNDNQHFGLIETPLRIWIWRWSLSLSFLANDFPQFSTKHLNGRSPVCIKAWRWRLPCVLKDRPQTLHAIVLHTCVMPSCSSFLQHLEQRLFFSACRKENIWSEETQKLGMELLYIYQRMRKRMGSKSRFTSA